MLVKALIDLGVKYEHIHFDSEEILEHIKIFEIKKEKNKIETSLAQRNISQTKKTKKV